MFHFEKRRLREGLINVYKFLAGGYKDEARIFRIVPSHGTGGNGHEPKCIKFPLNTRKYLLTASDIQKLQMVLGHLLQVVLLLQADSTR